MTTEIFHHTDLVHNSSVDERAQELGWKSNEYDTAIPMDFTDPIWDSLGVSLWAHGVVWSYKGTDFGTPLPLTYEANLILWIYSHTTGRQFKYVVDPREYGNEPLSAA
jgi:hypothetical protein